MARWRMGEHLKERDWGAVVLDLLIVILGVFLGIQVSNWNDARRDASSGRDYLLRIGEDLRADVRSLDQHEQYWHDAADAGARALSYAELGGERRSWELLNDFYAAGQNWNYSTIDTTYGELLSAGRLDLISNADLRRRLADYYAVRRDEVRFLAESEPEYRLHIRASVPYALQLTLLEKCQRGLGRLFTGNCPEPGTRSNVDRVVRAIVSDQKLIGELRTSMTNLYYLRKVGRDRRALAGDLLAKLDQELR